MASTQYFDEIFNGLETQSLPFTDKKSDKKTFAVYQYEHCLKKQIISEICNKFNINEQTLFNAVFSLVTARFSGTNDSLYVLVNEKTRPIYCKFDENTTVSDFLTQLEDQINKTQENALPFEEIVKRYKISTDLVCKNRCSPTYCGGAVEQSETEGGAKQSFAETLSGGSFFDLKDNIKDYNLAISVESNDNDYFLKASYRSDLYEETSIVNILQSYEAALNNLTKCQYVKNISILSKEQEAQLDKFNSTEVEYDSSMTVVDMFEEVVAKYPQNTAVVYQNKRISYEELSSISGKLAGYLINSGLKKEDVVAVLIPRCEYMAIVSIGVARSGCAYQPLDPTYPQDRLKFMIRDSEAKLLITTKEMQSLVPEYTGKILFVNEIADLPDYEAELPKPSPKDLFILLYTSGSTGIPKGCMLEFGNISAFCNHYRLLFGLNSSSKTTAYASYGFDASMMDIFCPLTSGAEVHIIPEDIRLDLIALNSYFEKNAITHAFMTTQVGRQFALGIKNISLKYLSTGGEKLVPMEPPTDYKFVNLYGPTEATVFITDFQVDKYYENIPIGKPTYNTKLYIADNHGNRLPFGACGELLVAGVQVARGYLKRPEKTKEVFIKNPFSQEKAYKRMYRTGDIVRLLSDGNLSFVGRRDAQVKIRGFRIELTEVEEVIRQFPTIKDATVVAFDDDGGGKYIAAYVVSDKKIDINALNEFILKTKPPYMVPAVTMQIDKIPLNQNQKVNKQALPKPEKEIEEIIVPKNEVQKRIFNCVAEALGHKNFGITTDFYYAGLTSISSLRLNILLSKEFNVNLKINDLKNNPTVEKLEQFLQSAEKTKTYKIQDVYPLTNTQEGIFIDCTANMGTTVYNLPFLFKLSSKIDLLKLKSAIETVIEAHKYLKVRLFMDKDGEIKQRRNDDEKFEVNIINGMNENELVKPFNLFGERLARFAIYRTHKGSHLFIDIHHLIADGTSYEIILNDIERAYKGEKIEPEEYTSYEAALDNAAAVKSELYEKSVNYFDSIFETCDGNTDFKPNLSYPKQGVKPGLGMLRMVGEKLKPENVKQICKKYGITENIFFNGVFGVLLATSISTDKSVFTTIYHGRNDSRFSNTVGMLVKTLPVLCDTSKDTDFYFKNLQTQILGMMNNDLLPFTEISREYKIIPNAMVVYQGEAFEFDKICGEKAERITLELNAAKTPISLDIFLKNDSYRFELEYRSDMYSKEYAQALIK
ncbi:MAG: amino acid adenylation domain-containing protein, partial [Candidatus Riflebacteria bacterium]|nr:amino acid adenylation domain-containing protein [Candidatus Riflebacteria bacterium]